MSDEKKAEPAVDITHDTINEQVIIAAVMMDLGLQRRYLGILSHDLFGDSKNSKIWKAMKELRRRKLTLDKAALLSELKGTVPAPSVSALLNAHSQLPANMEHHVEMLKWDGARVEVVNGPLTELLRALQDPLTPANRIKSFSKSVVAGFESFTCQGVRNPKAVAADAVAAIRERASQQVYEFGIEGLDKDDDDIWRIMPGLAPKKLTAVTGSSGSGKSTAVAKIGLQQARLGRKVLYGAWEMDDSDVLELMAIISLHEQYPSAGWTRYKMRTGNCTDAALQLFQDRCEEIGEFVKFMPCPQVNDGKQYSNDAALDEIEDRIIQIGADIAIFDLWERVLVDRKPEKERNALIRQQQMAKDTNCHALLVCQQKSKEIEERTNKRPTRNTIFGTSAWVEVPDTILGFYRPALWEQCPDTTFEILCLKQRFGKWPWVLEYDWDPDTVQLTNPREIDYTNPTSARVSKFEGIGGV